MLGLRPVFVVIINLIAGGLVTHGVLDPVYSNQFTQDADTVIGAIILLSTSLVSLYRLVHKHPIEVPFNRSIDTTSKQVTVTETTSTPVKIKPVETLPVVDGGTPPTVQ